MLYEIIRYIKKKHIPLALIISSLLKTCRGSRMLFQRKIWSKCWNLHLEFLKVIYCALLHLIDGQILIYWRSSTAERWNPMSPSTANSNLNSLLYQQSHSEEMDLFCITIHLYFWSAAPFNERVNNAKGLISQWSELCLAYQYWHDTNLSMLEVILNCEYLIQ